jgi:hypothetical protein
MAENMVTGKNVVERIQDYKNQKQKTGYKQK